MRSMLPKIMRFRNKSSHIMLLNKAPMYWRAGAGEKQYHIVILAENRN